MKKALTLSIVIPVYNEQDYLPVCLEAIAKQTTKPLEVIVVDNNSVDQTREIARRYPFVRLLSETRQGQIFAQAKGFNAAKGDILGRLDADSIVPTNWVENIFKAFAADPKTIAVTGDGEPYDLKLKRIGLFVFRLYHQRLSGWVAGHVMLWGANMALRRSYWLKIKDQIHYRTDIWEDYELSFLLAPLGQLSYLPNICIGCSFRAAHHSLKWQTLYQYRAVRTFSLRTSRLRTIWFAVVWVTLYWVFPFSLADRLLWRLRQSH